MSQCEKCGQPLEQHRRNPYGIGCIVETDECARINARAKKARSNDWPERLALDPFERIDLLAAEWRNAYRAFERRDKSAAEDHLLAALMHGLELVKGLG